MKQATFAGLAFDAKKKKKTKREKIKVVPWSRLQALIVPLYPTARRCRFRWC